MWLKSFRIIRLLTVRVADEDQNADRGVAKRLRHRILIPVCEGSNPSTPAKTLLLQCFLRTTNCAGIAENLCIL